MPEVNQYAFTNRELLELLIKEAGVHKGKWSLSITFGVAIGPMGPPEQPSPGVATIVNGVGIQRLADGQLDPAALDAAEINPHATNATKRRKSG